MSVPRPPADARPHRTLRSNYRLLGLIGQGQFGKVYCATHRKSGKIVALKSLDRYRQSTQQLLRELRFLLSLRHRNIAGCQALEYTTRGRYLVMEYCPGGTLRELLENDQCLINWSQGLKLMIDVLKGLAHAHAQKIIHCDIKPENILLEPTAQGWVARITDFGIAHLMQEAAAGDSGSPAYMAPERFYGQYHLSSDLYAVGIMLFELLVGERPFTGTPIELRSAHLNQQPPIPDSLPPSLAQVLRQALKKLPGQRFQSAQSMGEALQQAAQELPPTPEPGQSPFFRWSGEVPTSQLLPIPLATLKLPPDLTTLNLSPSSKGYKIHWVQNHHLHESTYSLEDGTPPSFTDSVKIQRQISLETHALQIHPSRWGLWVVTEQGIHLWPNNHPEQLPLILRWQTPQKRSITTDLSQRWFITTSTQANRALLLGTFRPQRQVIRSFKPSIETSQAFILDAQGHSIILGKRQQETWIQGLNRRGKKLGEWLLPVHLEQGILGTKPYRIVGIEPGLPHLIFLDLKPYRLRRIHLPGFPQSLARFPWGYAVSNEHYLFILDTEGRLLGQWKDLGNVATILYPLGDKHLGIVQTTPQETMVRIWNVMDLNLDMIF